MAQAIPIYYVEDTAKEYKELFYYLNLEKIDVYPKLDAYEAEKAILEHYFREPGKETAMKVVDMFKKYKPVLFIMDIRLFGDDSGGIFVTNNIIKTDKAFENAKILYLSNFPKETFSSQNERYCPKIQDDPKTTSEHVITMIRLMMNVKRVSSISDILKDLFR